VISAEAASAAAAAAAFPAFITAPRGACQIDPADPLLDAAIKVTHFGLQQQQQQHSHNQPGGSQRTAGKLLACHRPGRDVVAAPYFNKQEVTHSAATTSCFSSHKSIVLQSA
jgi:hypothetical protein